VFGTAFAVLFRRKRRKIPPNASLPTRLFQPHAKAKRGIWTGRQKIGEASSRPRCAYSARAYRPRSPKQGLRHMMIHDIYVFSFSRGWCWMFWSTWPFLSIVWCLCSKIPSVIIHYLAKHIPADEWCLIIAFSVDYEMLGWKISNMLHSGLIDVYDVLMFLGNLEHARGWENGVPRFFCFRNARN